MIAEIFPEAYDAVGRQVSNPFDRRHGIHSTFPMGRYVNHPLSVKCETLDDLRKFLQGCRSVSDEKQFGKRDYWQPPDEFERTKAGDCEDFSFWAWRELMEMGFDARFVGGKYGLFDAGHAWVEFFQDGKCFLLEPQRRFLGERMPRLSSLRYKPRYSVAWDGQHLRYFAHKNPDTEPGFLVLLGFVPEWIAIWSWYWIRALPRLPYFVVRKAWQGISQIPRRSPQSR
jgi:hypothetical protein